MKLKTKIILIFSSIFLITSIFSSIFYVNYQKKKAYDNIKNEVSVLATHYEDVFFETGQYNLTEYNLVSKYLNGDLDNRDNFLKKVEDVRLLISNLVSTKVYVNDSIYIDDDFVFKENVIYHRIIDTIKTKNNKKHSLELVFEINLNMKSPSKHLNYYLLKFSENKDSVSIIIGDNNKISVYDIDSTFIKNLLKGYKGYEPRYTRNIIIGQKPKGFVISNKEMIDMNYYIYDMLLDFIFIIEPDMELINSEINKNLHRDIFLNYSVLFLLVLGMVYFTLNFVLKDIYVVKNALNEIKKGNLNHRLIFKRKDELGDLMKNFNLMSEKLEFEVINNEKLEKLNENLQEEHDKYRALLDSTFEAIFLSDKGYCIDCNKAACKMFGYKYEEMLKIFGTDVIAEEDKDTVRKNMLSEYEIPYKATCQRKDGSQFPALLRGRMFNYRGKKLRATSVIDISSATKLEEANKILSEEINKFKALINVSDDGIVLMSLDNNEIVQFNNSLFTLFGMSEKELSEKYKRPMELIENWVNSDSIDKLKEYFLKEIPYTVKLLKMDGTTFDCRIKAKNIILNGKKYRISVLRDISDKKALQEANKELATINEFFNISTSLLSLFYEGYFIKVNPSFTQLLGYTEEELLSKHVSEFVHPDDIDSTYKEIENIKKGYITKNFTNRYKKKDGEYVWLNWYTISKDGIFYSAAQDITEIKKYQKELEEALDNLTKSNKELEQFAYIASHDLQEPLRTITSFLELFEEKYYDSVDQDGKEFISYIMVAAHKQKKLISDLLKYSRLDTRKKEIKEHDLNQILELTIMNLNMLIDEKHAVISSKELPKINCDFTQISQVFENLIKNAIKFNKSKNPHIKIDYEDGEDEILLIFEDNGVGIDKQYHEKIFQAFQRLSNDDTGTGIGLAIVNKVVSNHNGRIWLESNEGTGSKFYLTLSKNLEVK